jgi:hypothetical protein
MTKLRVLLLVCACALLPSSARADDGGFWEWLEKMSGPKLQGIGTDFHFFCINSENRAVNCERFFGLKTMSETMENIKHQLDFRLAFYWKYGDRFSDDPTDTRRIQAAKLMAFYRYFATNWLELGFGAGYMPFFGDGFEIFSRGIITPMSVTVAPFSYKALKGLTFRAENSYITNGFTGGDFGNSVTKFATGGEWNTSVSIGYDVRRYKNSRR